MAHYVVAGWLRGASGDATRWAALASITFQTKACDSYAKNEKPQRMAGVFLNL